MPMYLDTGLNLIDVDDVAEGHLLAAERGRVGERYLLGHRNMTLREILECLSALTGLSAPRAKLPYAAALGIAHASEFFTGTLLGRPPAVPLEGVRMASKRMFFDAAKARRELGLPQSPVDRALERAVRWFCEHGHAPWPPKMAPRSAAGGSE
jgi:dihydroflavonol-4-reductase